MVDRVNQRTVQGDVSIDVDPLEIGDASLASGEDAAAVGVGSTASGDRSVAVGTDSTADRPDLVSFGDRYVQLEDGRSLVFPPDQGVQTLVDLLIEDAPEGETHSVSIDAAGEDVFRVKTEADGQGGIKNKLVSVLADLAVTGDTTEVEEVVTGVVEVEDGSGSVQFTMDATQSPPVVDLAGNDIDDLNRINPSGEDLLVDGDVTISGEFEEGSSL